MRVAAVGGEVDTDQGPAFALDAEDLRRREIVPVVQETQVQIAGLPGRSPVRQQRPPLVPQIAAVDRTQGKIAVKDTLSPPPGTWSFKKVLTSVRGWSSLVKYGSSSRGQGRGMRCSSRPGVMRCPADFAAASSCGNVTRPSVARSTSVSTLRFSSVE